MRQSLKMFEGFGVELEYMIVDKTTLKITPLADELLKKVAGKYVSDFEFGEIGWSNELVLHVIELKTNGPAKSLKDLDSKFFDNIKYINNLLEEYNCMLLPTGTHPFMDPFTETKLWNHEYNKVYEAYNRIFDCRGHGWSNLQSTHINLPFSEDEEFGKLHAAIRVLLPIIPALSASTPIIESKYTGFFDSRLEVYRTNQQKIPSIAGRIVPEQAFTISDYEDLILNKIYSEIEPYDTDDILKYEWLNSRGAIARFDRNTFEIRIIDIQECPAADIAITSIIVETLKLLIDQTWTTLEEQMKWDDLELSGLLLSVIKYGEKYSIENERYLKLFGIDKKCTANDLWKQILNNLNLEKEFLENIEIILNEGSLSTRILNSINGDYSRECLVNTYNKLAVCLATNTMFADRK